MESRSVRPAIGSGRARTGCDIRMCGVLMVGGSLAGQHIIKGAFCSCRVWVHVAQGRAASTSCLVGGFDDALGGALLARWQTAHARRLRYCMVCSDDVAEAEDRLFIPTARTRS
jgi:hypothetical protein